MAAALAEFAEAEQATQLVLGASHRSRWKELIQGSVINAVARGAGAFDLHVISYDTSGDGRAAAAGPTRSRRALAPRRRPTGWLSPCSGVPLSPLGSSRSATSSSCRATSWRSCMLVVLAAAVGGVGPGLAAAVAGSLALNWYFTEPVHTFTIAEAENVARPRRLPRRGRW